MKKIFILLTHLLAMASSRAVHLDNSTAVPRDTESTDRRCDCYMVSGLDPGYYQNYRLWDFRHVPLQVKRRGDSDLDEEMSTEQNGRHSGSILLSETGFAKDWKSQAWHRPGSTKGPVPISNSKWNVFFARNPENTYGPDSTYLILRTTRFPDHSSTAEIESRLTNIFHSSFRIRMRVLTPDSIPRAVRESAHEYPAVLPKTALTNTNMATRGACIGIFIYASVDCESDIEILTSDPPTLVHYANQPDYDPKTDTAIPGASVVANIPNPWTSWVTHRLDWFPDFSRWFADGQMLAAMNYRVPARPSMTAINLWNDGGQWTGDMGVGESVYIAIDWIQMIYNVSSSGPAVNSCLRPCWVEDAP